MKKTILKTLLHYGVLSLVCVGLGVVAGLSLAAVFKKEIVVYEGDADDYKEDAPAAVSKYNAIKADDGDYTKLEPYEACSVAFYLFQQCNASSSIGVGQTIAFGGIKQDILTATAHLNGKYMEESISKGLIPIYDRMYQEGDSTIKYWGTTGNYADYEAQTISNDEYQSQMGRKVSDPLAYIVSEATLSNDNHSGDGLSSIARIEGGYRIELELDPMTSVLNYQKQMQTISDLKAPPAFEYVHLSIITSDTLSLKYMATHEKYTAISTKPIEMNARCEGRLTTVYRLPPAQIEWIDLDKKVDYPNTAEALLQRYGLA